jgi:hypothetical protein
MRLKKVTGCIADSLTAEFDGEDIEEINMTPEQRMQVIEKIADWMKKNPDQLNYIMQDMTESFGEYENDGHVCECCGDTITTWTWDI